MKALFHQWLLALAFLTRLPIDWIMPMRALPLASSIWAFPLAGALIGGVASLPLLLPFPSLLNAVLSVGVAIWITGGLHLNALADFVDAAGSQNRTARLKIMGDARIGRVGGVALIVAGLIRVVAISLIGPFELIAATAGGRVAIVTVINALPHACADETAFAMGRPSKWNFIAAYAIYAVILVVSVDDWLIPLGFGFAVTAIVISRARKWLNGYTADVLGAAAILTEIAMLAMMALTR